jgi:hypothetical protein
MFCLFSSRGEPILTNFYIIRNYFDLLMLYDLLHRPVVDMKYNGPA